MIKVNILLLKKNEMSVYNELLKFYKNVMRCTKCHKLFGTDLGKSKCCVYCDDNYRSFKDGKCFDHKLYKYQAKEYNYSKKERTIHI